MQALVHGKTVTADRAHLLDSIVGPLEGSRLRCCVIGGQAVSVYVEPVVTLTR